MRIYNSLTRKVENLEFGDPKRVGIYTCGPTVYSYVSVGNWRTYVLGDILVRTLAYFDNHVTYVMNITDVGHLTGDNLGDADTGEDRMEKASKSEGKTVWDIAEHYTEDFLDGFAALNMIIPTKICRATEHIPEQIDLVKKIFEKGFAYQISDGVYFDVGAYEEGGNKYGELSTLDSIKEGARVEPNAEKRDPRDFALWKFSPEGAKRQMEWDSPWGVGFPGWHIECSAMSMKYLGEKFDIHVGGEDLRSTHHPNEIAQSEAATGVKPFVKYWVHGAFVKVDGKRMGKSLGNAYTLHDIEKNGFEPMALRYLYLTGGYREQLNFTWESLGAAASALNKLRSFVSGYKLVQENTRTKLSEEKLENVDEYNARFRDAISNDLNMPQAVAVAWEVIKSNIPNQDKLDLILQFDEVFGLKLSETRVAVDPTENIDSVILGLLTEREQARKSGDFERADEIREQILEKGFEILDTDSGAKLKPAQNVKNE